MPDSEQSPGLPTSRGLVSANSGNGEQGAMASTSNPSTTSSAAVVKAMVKYGELVILGYNGQLPQGNFDETIL